VYKARDPPVLDLAALLRRVSTDLLASPDLATKDVPTADLAN